MHTIFPISLKIRGRQCIVVGGGAVAAQKVNALLACDASVTVISPALCGELSRLKSEGTIAHIPREYEPGDLQDAFMIVAATDDRAINGGVFQEAQARNALVNVVDVPELCNFYFPSIVRRGALTLSIATDGIAPTLSKALREWLEAEFDDGYGELLELFAETRSEVKERFNTFVERQRAWRRIVERREEILTMLRAGHREMAKERVRSCIS